MHPGQFSSRSSARASSSAVPCWPPVASLARPASPFKAPGAAGFIQRWLVLEPIPVSNQLTEPAVHDAVKKHAAALAAAIPRDGDTVAVGDQTLAWHAVDTLGYIVNLFHFAYARHKP